VSRVSEAAAAVRRLAAPACAKINFGLALVGRRPDGYHELQSVFVPLDLADDLQLELAPSAGAEVTLAVESEAGFPGGAIPTDDRNLAVRAGRAFLERSGLAFSLAIRLSKRIPVAAGLGGGSSDAGAVLRALDEAFPEAIDPGTLAGIALELGADVPFFLDPRPAWVGGIGERIEALPVWPEFALVLLNPGIPLSTAEVFRATDVLQPALTPPGAAPTLRSLREIAGIVASNRPDALASLLSNDLLPAAVRLCPPVARLQERLRHAGASMVGMSGSGPTVFGVFGNADEAHEAVERMQTVAPIWARVALGAKSG
jgi:4-diphosphocytidyl-2-C-methyl-D-erythritol kinase